MTEAEFAAELRAFARRLRHRSMFDADAIAAVARAMNARADELARSKLRQRMRLTTITVGGRTVVVQQPRPRFGL